MSQQKVNIHNTPALSKSTAGVGDPRDLHVPSGDYIKRIKEATKSFLEEYDREILGGAK